MPLTKLKSISQNTWLGNGKGPEARIGLCYYMCNFVESADEIWNKPDSFDNAISSAQNFSSATKMINYAKAQLTRKAPQIPVYPVVVGALENNRIYRGGLWFGLITNVIGDPNHEFIIITGSNDDVAYFEPNFGFYQVSNPGMNNREAVEHFINEQYGPGSHTGNFQYNNVRSIKQSSPLGFN
ncbi:hypothetical protein [Agarilytica rhodophyticola]|uniref:hypothetical protein n=1 Tax=Agarilytica rhodophyticola TaxID=1737490 RepID=UPI000B3436D5|nr:hypothetical protein [Agarilytica rhodophyticola]